VSVISLPRIIVYLSIGAFIHILIHGETSWLNPTTYVAIILWPLNLAYHFIVWTTSILIMIIIAVFIWCRLKASKHSVNGIR
jgi:hypothetical protein